jgi:hypothetical protein
LFYFETYIYIRNGYTIVISGVRHQPLVVLTAVCSQIRWIRTVVAHMAQRDAPGREASAGLFVARTLVPVVTDVYEGQFLETDVGPGELFLTLVLFRRIFSGEGRLGPGREKRIPCVFQFSCGQEGIRVPPPVRVFLEHVVAELGEDLCFVVDFRQILLAELVVDDEVLQCRERVVPRHHEACSGTEGS